MILMDTIKFRLLWATDQYVYETIRIMKRSLQPWDVDKSQPTSPT